MSITTTRYLAMACGLALAGPLAAQQPLKLPKTSRTVYKCQVSDQVNYSDAPCLGAKKVDVTPTRGLDKDSGQKRTGADVRTERHQEQMTDILRPALGMTHDERMTMHRRFKLSPAAKRQCDQLDTSMAKLEAQERAAPQQDRTGIQQALLTDRARFKALAC